MTLKEISRTFPDNLPTRNILLCTKGLFHSPIWKNSFQNLFSKLPQKLNRVLQKSFNGKINITIHFSVKELTIPSSRIELSYPEIVPLSALIDFNAMN